MTQLTRLRHVRQVALPESLFAGVFPHLVQAYRQRAVAEPPTFWFARAAGPANYPEQATRLAGVSSAWSGESLVDECGCADLTFTDIDLLNQSARNVTE